MDVTDFDNIMLMLFSVVIIFNTTLIVIVIAEIVKYQQLREDRITLFLLSPSLSDLATGCTVMSCQRRRVFQYITKCSQQTCEMCTVWFFFTCMNSF